MQIRIGNKQDEQSCRDLAQSCLLENGITYNLDKNESDLKNIELSYLGRDGIFIVCEDDQQVVAFAAAARGDSDDVCLMPRLYVSQSSRGRGIGKKLVEQLVFFAKNLDYESLLTVVPNAKPNSQNNLKTLATFLAKMNFKLISESAENAIYERLLSTTS